MKRRSEKEKRSRIRVALLASVLLGLGVFAGSGFSKSASAIDAFSPNHALQIAKSPLIDQVATSGERHLRTQNSAPRRQTPGAIAAGNPPELAPVSGERSTVEARFNSRAILSSPNNRAPPRLIA